jgi:hypothetical protein
MPPKHAIIRPVGVHKGCVDCFYTDVWDMNSKKKVHAIEMSFSAKFRTDVKDARDVDCESDSRLADRSGRHLGGQLK